ncbi:hypothetical protein CLOBY_23690 [Clostridium saccharobutylicum]|uniref:CsxC family protein n=1 Tax=Clostridium saccharobutylicum TaxID=169679 RepID=UPI00098408B9|nr:hypothetical protein [Clostridium saccharobutylicum]AQS10226.1 hypothetical protein CLOBY_23690 [Clostridium saccharobutylicum]MBC2436493.1 hypothetical protein [Clostridium saccharobutylicum]NSB87623.1 hypothetical protein [Clostridium saccharobutylicum]NYC31158.1 hypothetical protein [Clostridium saccharobutylicum]OOM17728.1 hypothetical protein CLSAB_14190 [Clostridium saccharobutylicum]
MSDNKGLNIENTNGCCDVADPCATVATVIEPLTEQSNVAPVVPATSVLVKVPVVLAETNITIPVEATITLDQPVREIKRIKKNVFLTQSRLIPFSATPATPGTGILFIAGFVRKNIEYATQTCITPGTPNFCGNIGQCTVEVPFNFTTRVTFIRTPIFTENTTPSELEYFTDQLQSCDTCADPVLGRNPCDQSFSFTEFFNEKPFVELISAVVTEVDIHRNPTASCELPTEQLFSTLTEKLVVNLTLKVLQKRQVIVTGRIV